VTLIIFAFDVMGIWGDLTFVDLCIDHGRGDVFPTLVTFFNLY